MGLLWSEQAQHLVAVQMSAQSIAVDPAQQPLHMLM